MGGAGTGIGRRQQLRRRSPAGTLTLLNRQPSGGLPLLRQRPPSGGGLRRELRQRARGLLPGAAGRNPGPSPERGAAPGQRPRGGRQEGPHAHSIGPSPDGRFVLACDLGIDRDGVPPGPDGQPFGPCWRTIPRRGGQSSSGPRYFAFHPRLPYVYVVNELDSHGHRLRLRPRTGALDNVQTVPRLPPISAGRATLPRSSRTPRGASSTPPTGGTTASPSSPWTAPAGASPLPGTPPRRARPAQLQRPPRGAPAPGGEPGQRDGGAVPHRPSEALTPTGRVTETPPPVCIIFRED